MILSRVAGQKLLQVIVNGVDHLQEIGLRQAAHRGPPASCRLPSRAFCCRILPGVLAVALWVGCGTIGPEPIPPPSPCGICEKKGHSTRS
jgi:hypothetical protein